MTGIESTCFNNIDLNTIAEKQLSVSRINCNGTELLRTSTEMEHNAIESEDEYERLMENDITILKNFKDLNLKEYKTANQDKKSVNKAFLNIIINEEKQMTVGKSWLFSEKKHLSSDTRIRVRGMSSNNVNFHREKRGIQHRQKPSLQQEAATETESEIETSTETSESNIELDSTFDSTEVLSISNETEDENCDSQSDICTINLEMEKYYSVYYDETWYIGRIIQKKETSCTIKFLKEELDKFMWPSADDIKIVNSEYIFYGPIALEGIGPFSIKRHDLILIKKEYKELKKKMQGK
uniref:Tudor domain-containing protein n=1 Tax=Photinus pyralis TaxID=7054 RepID=A0A1Y1K7X6_PHOPY